MRTESSGRPTCGGRPTKNPSGHAGRLCRRLSRAWDLACREWVTSRPAMARIRATGESFLSRPRGWPVPPRPEGRATSRRMLVKYAVRPLAFSTAFLLASTLVPGGAAFAQGGMWRPDPALGAAPMIESRTFRPGTHAPRPQVAQARMYQNFAPVAPRYRAIADHRTPGRAALAGPAPAWRTPGHQARPTQHSMPGQMSGHPWATAPMHAPLPWSAPLPPSAPAHAGYAAYAVPPMPFWRGMQPMQWLPALAQQGYPHAQQPAMYQPAPPPAAGRWSLPARGPMDPRPLPGGWRPDPLAAATTASHYRAPASAYTSPRKPVFRGAPMASRHYAAVRPAPRALAAPGYWRPDTTTAWASSQAFRPVAYGRSIARGEQSNRTIAQATQRSHGDLPGWATTLDRFEEAGQCAWCSSGT